MLVLSGWFHWLANVGALRIISTWCPEPGGWQLWLTSSRCGERSVLTPGWNYSFDLLSIAPAILIIHNGLPQRILPLCLTAQLKCLCSDPCPPVDCRKKEINTFPLPEEIFARIQWSFYFVSSPPSISDLWKNLASRPGQYAYYETLVCHLLGQLACWIKLYSLA